MRKNGKKHEYDFTCDIHSTHDTPRIGEYHPEYTVSFLLQFSLQLKYMELTFK